jgi:hypothetical protein
MAFECGAIRVYFTDSCQRENLETARIGENGTRPPHKFVQAAHFRHQVSAWTQVEMVCIAQHYEVPNSLSWAG